MQLRHQLGWSVETRYGGDWGIHQMARPLMPVEPCCAGGESAAGRRAFTLIEVMLTMGLLMMLIGGALAALMFLGRATARMSDYTAAVAAVQGRMEAVRAATYNPPSTPFLAADLILTNRISVALAQSGTNYLLLGTIVTIISPKASGHLVTVTGTFPARGLPVTISMQSLVNRFSGGQQ